MSLTLYPAIDLKAGRVVRLLRGDLDQATVYNEDPADQARRFAALGFDWLHVVDLDGAIQGESANRTAVQAIIASTDRPVQLGGGIRTLEAIETWLAAGVARVILGTVAARQPALVAAACRTFPGRIAAGIDARSGKVAVAGWVEGSDIDALDLARRMEQAGVAAIIHTDIDRDGALVGLNVDATAEIAAAVGVPVIASGGVAGLADIKALVDRTEAGIAGAVIGRALYDGRLDAAAALAMARGKG